MCGSKNLYGGRSSVGRAPDCDSGGRGFNPRRPPHLTPLVISPIFDLTAALVFTADFTNH